MADLGSSRKWLVPEDSEVKRRWTSCQIQERKSQIVRLKQDIEDLIHGHIVKLEATIMMLEKEIRELESSFNSIDISNK